MAVGIVSNLAVAQQDWQPSRLPVDANAQALPQVQSQAQGLAQPNQAARTSGPAEQQLGAGAVLRWRTTAPRGAQPVENRPIAQPSTLNWSSSTVNQNSSGSIGSQGSYLSQASGGYDSAPAHNVIRATAIASTSGGSSVPSSEFTSGEYAASKITSDNPLRHASNGRSNDLDNPVRQAAYQQEWNGSVADSTPQWRSVNTRLTQDAPQKDNGFPDFPGALPNRSAPDALPEDVRRLPDNNALRNPPGGNQDFFQQTPPVDPLDKPEAAPQPPQSNPQAKTQDPPSFPPQVKEDRSPADQSRRDRIVDPDKLAPLRNPPRDQQGQMPRNSDELDDLLKKARKAAIPNCETQRDLLRGQPLSSVNLNVAPALSNGLRGTDKDESSKLKDEFDKRTLRRDWTDIKGDVLATGRMKELRHHNVVIEVDGTERLLPLSELSDIDMDYIADLWNLPFRCGGGYEPLLGRNFMASTVQWKASGACHNPLYFEQVQLERYGHEAGPIVQPLISTAHFFLTIPILPYKMGINPPNECQYALGYYRPGNCAPYMMPSVPLSLRGGLVQAGAVLGTAAVLP